LLSPFYVLHFCKNKRESESVYTIYSHRKSFGFRYPQKITFQKHIIMKGFACMQKPDTVTTIGQSTVQHGPYNDRVYLIKLHLSDYPFIVNEIKELAEKYDYSKIFAKVHSSARNGFIEAGFEQEASIPDFYGPGSPVFFMSLFRKPKRKEHADYSLLSEIIEQSETWKPQTTPPQLPSGWGSFKCTINDISEMVKIYKEIFPTYPFPIHDPVFIKSTMNSGVFYYGIRDNKSQLIALSSADTDLSTHSAEMTDFATLTSARGNHCGLHLLSKMDEEMHKEGIKSAFTIARSASYGMNKIFKQRCYLYGGSLIKNTNISGSMEDMNVWYKQF
jgi:beta-lysine N6-acetyltransferase